MSPNLKAPLTSIFDREPKYLFIPSATSITVVATPLPMLIERCLLSDKVKQSTVARATSFTKTKSLDSAPSSKILIVLPVLARFEKIANIPV